jgi:hypothetical protein
MRITRGLYSGYDATLHQAANNWLSVNVQLAPDVVKAVVLNPTAGTYSRDEIAWLLGHAAGQFWAEYQIAEKYNRQPLSEHVRLKRVRRR